MNPLIEYRYYELSGLIDKVILGDCMKISEADKIKLIRLTGLSLCTALSALILSY